MWFSPRFCIRAIGFSYFNLFCSNDNIRTRYIGYKDFIEDSKPNELQ